MLGLALAVGGRAVEHRPETWGRIDFPDGMSYTVLWVTDDVFRVEVTGTWRNRLIYDAAQPEAERRIWTTPMLKPDEAFAEAGILGPVGLAK